MWLQWVENSSRLLGSFTVWTEIFGSSKDEARWVNENWCGFYFSFGEISITMSTKLSWQANDGAATTEYFHLFINNCWLSFYVILITSWSYLAPLFIGFPLVINFVQPMEKEFNKQDAFNILTNQMKINNFIQYYYQVCITKKCATQWGTRVQIIKKEIIENLKDWKSYFS